MIRFLKYTLVFILISCSNTTQTKEVKAIAKKEEQDAKVEVATIAERTTVTENFSKAVIQLSEENTSFNNLGVQIQKLNTIRIKDFSGEMKAIKEDCNEFLKTIPNAFKTKSVYSRIDAIKTFAKGLNFEKKKGFRDTTKSYAYSVGLVESYNSLIIQLNDSKNVLPKEVKESLKATLEIKKDSVSGEKPLF